MAAPNPGQSSAPAPKPDHMLNISVEEYSRTRDSVVTGLTTLIGAINELIRAYIHHTNSLLSGSASAGGVDTYAISNFLSNATNAAQLTADGLKPKRKRQKKERDPNAPKRPLTAFFLYSSSAREIVKNDLGESPAIEVNNEILRRWKAMGDDEKKGWKDEYEKNNEEYKKAVLKYKAETGKELEDAEHEVEDVPDPLLQAIAGAVASELEDPKVVVPAKGKTPKKRKGKETEKLPSPSPSAQLKETPVPLPGESKKRKKAEEEGDLSKKKKPRKSAKDDEKSSEPAPEPSKKEKKKKRKD